MKTQLSLRLFNSIILFFLISILFSHKAVAIMSDTGNAISLANQAKGNVEGVDKKYTHKARKSMIQSRRNSPLTAQTSATCGGVAIGNVTPDLGDHRQHNTVVIIRGHIINTNNKC